MVGQVLAWLIPRDDPIKFKFWGKNYYSMQNRIIFSSLQDRIQEKNPYIQVIVEKELSNNMLWLGETNRSISEQSSLFIIQQGYFN